MVDRKVQREEWGQDRPVTLVRLISLLCMSLSSPWLLSNRHAHNENVKRKNEEGTKTQNNIATQQHNEAIEYEKKFKPECEKLMKETPGKKWNGCEQFQHQTPPYRSKDKSEVACSCARRGTKWCTKEGKAIKNNNAQNRQDCDAETRNYDSGNCGAGRTYKLPTFMPCINPFDGDCKKRREAAYKKCDELAGKLDSCRARKLCYFKETCLPQSYCTCPTRCHILGT